MTHSVESRFIAIVSGALLAVVAPLLTLLLILSYYQTVASQRDHLEILMVANSQALGRPLWDLDDDSINQITGTLVSDPAIYMVKVRDTSGKLDIVQTSNRALPDNVHTLSRAISYKPLDRDMPVGTMTVYFADVQFLGSRSATELAFMSIFVLAILTVFATAIIGNRLMIIKPLLRLTAAIEATRRLGSRHQVDWHSTDEMGRLAESFNQMQIQLEREGREILEAHQRTTEIYNRTPAMLFSLDPADRISAVSDYWVEATGYQRDAVLGRSFADLVFPEDRVNFVMRKRADDGTKGNSDVTVRFQCHDGALMDVLILEKELNAGHSYHRSETLSVMTNVTELRQSEKRNRQQAISDHLTGLLNRQGFEAVLDEQIRIADTNGTELACLFIDLDRFKAINDTLGHAVGDAVLRGFVERLNPMLGSLDNASRLGGDEFAILLAGRGAQERAATVCDRISDMFCTAFEIDEHSVRLSASIGLALYPTHASSPSELLQKSDMAMYSRKRAGKNGAQVFDPAIMNQARERAEIEQDIEQAIAEGWFEAYFQPILELDTGRTIGFEALMRLNHPRKGILPPAALISVAEENGSIGRIGNIILEDAIANLAHVSRLPGLEDCYVAVNFSALQFEPSLANQIAARLHRHGIAPRRLVVEITEAVLMRDDPQIRTILNSIHMFGCRIALDDFGTGYSSLSYLNRFPVDIVKIDQSFTRSVSDDTDEVGHKSRMLVEGISAISHKMNCIVIAEGVETQEQKDVLRQFGVDCGQGYLFARPQNIETLIKEIGGRHGMARDAKVGT